MYVLREIRVLNSDAETHGSFNFNVTPVPLARLNKHPCQKQVVANK
jgi:hypothetical protein